LLIGETPFPPAETRVASGTENASTISRHVSDESSRRRMTRIANGVSSVCLSVVMTILR
jgi:hypothetical protein